MAAVGAHRKLSTSLLGFRFAPNPAISGHRRRWAKDAPEADRRKRPGWSPR